MFRNAWVPLSVVCLAASLLVQPAIAQEEPQTDSLGADWGKTAASAQEALENRSASSEALESLRIRLANDREAAFQISKSGSVKVRALEAQLEALGPPPAEGESEGAEITDRRIELTEEIATANAPILAAKEAYERAELLIGELDSLIRAQSASKLLARNPTPLLPTRWPPAFIEFYEYTKHVSREVRQSLGRNITAARLKASAPSILFLVALGLLLLLVAQPLAAARFKRAAKAAGRQWRGLCYAALRNISYLAFPSLGAISVLAAFNLASVTPPSANSLLNVAPEMAGLLIGAHWLGHSLFGRVVYPSAVFNLDDRLARRGLRLCQALGVLLAAERGFEAIEKDFEFSASSAAVLSGLGIIVGSILLWALAKLLLRSEAGSSSADAASAPDGDDGTNFHVVLARLMQTSAVLAAIFAAAGFVNLAREALIPMILSIGLIGFAIVVYGVIMQVIEMIGGSSDEPDGEQGSLLPIAVIFVLSLAAAPILALTWGARPADISEAWRLLVNGIEIGDTRISLDALIMLVVVFSVGLVATRWLQKLLRKTVLPHTKLDLGAQQALVTGIGYVGLTLAALAAVSAAGLNLSNLAVVAGALSVGIGFGLQQVVSNFVSGIILLIERPIKEGDWIEVSGYSGIVQKIAVRSTRIQTFDQHDVIIPNSDLIAGAVKNMTLSSMRGRAIIPVGVGYGSDLERTKEILTDAAANHPLISAHHPPQVVFLGLGESSLDFELRVVLTDVGAAVSAKSDLLFTIYTELGKAGIEIPFPQRDIHLRDIDRLIDALGGRPAGRESQRDKEKAVKPAT